MLYNPKYNEEGKKYLCRMNGENSDMLMDIYVKKLAEGETLTVDEDKNECAILLLRGAVNFTVGDSINEDCERANPFQKTPYAVHFSHGTKAVVTAKKESEVIVQMTDNDRTWEPVFYNPDNCLVMCCTAVAAADDDLAAVQRRIQPFQHRNQLFRHLKRVRRTAFAAEFSGTKMRRKLRISFIRIFCHFISS